MTTFIAVVRSHGRSGYGASFPDFPGCTADGPTLDQVIARAREALLTHIQQLLDGGKPVCVPSAADAVERGDALLVAIDVPDDVRAVEIEISVPALALARIDSFAQRHRLSRVGLFVESVDRWATEEAVLRARREGMPDGPTLFDFSNPLELRVETFERDVVQSEPIVEERQELADPEAADDVASEMARLLDESSRSTGQDMPDDVSEDGEKPR